MVLFRADFQPHITLNGVHEIVRILVLRTFLQSQFTAQAIPVEMPQTHHGHIDHSGLTVEGIGQKPVLRHIQHASGGAGVGLHVKTDIGAAGSL